MRFLNILLSPAYLILSLIGIIYLLVLVAQTLINLLFVIVLGNVKLIIK